MQSSKFWSLRIFIFFSSSWGVIFVTFGSFWFLWDVKFVILKILKYNFHAVIVKLSFENFWIFFLRRDIRALTILKCSLRNSDLRIFRFFWSSWYWLWKFWNIVLRNLTSLRIFKFFWYRTRQIFAIINFEISNKYDKLNFEIFT